MRSLARIACWLLALAASGASLAGPQHWGSGYPYLVTLERSKGAVRLCAYEPPMRAKTRSWLRRWVDASPALAAAPGPIAVGDFWPAGVSKEYVALLTSSKAGRSISFLGAPEAFGRAPWAWVGKTPWPARWTPRQLLAARLPGDPNDSLLALGDGAIRAYKVGGTPARPTLTPGPTLALPKGLHAEQVAAGDFWGDGATRFVALAEGRAVYLDLVGGKLSEACRANFPMKPLWLAGADFVKDGFDTFAGVAANGLLNVYSAPLRPGKKKPEGPNYTGRALSRQPLPGASGSNMGVTMSGFPQTSGQILGASAGRVFGYVAEETTTAVRKRNGRDPRPDAEIAFVSRFPTHSLTAGAPHFGWPLYGETYGYDIAIKNNGDRAIPAGAKLTVWLAARERNVDTSPKPSVGRPTLVTTLKQPIPPFDPMNPKYVKVRVQGKWPYRLVPCSPEATWKKLNLGEVGERWLVCRLDAPGDRTVRNNRYEAALHAHTYHPIFRENANLANRLPTVASDPNSLEYLSRKMADAITVVWERSGTTQNDDVLQRTYFDGYEIGFPDDQRPEAKRLEAWRVVQDKWEGWRELDLWWGENQSWEKFDWSYSAELHESGHLFHPLGDLYGNYVMPVWLRSIRKADGSPVQIRTNLWGPDLFGSGDALIGPNACELMARYIVGARGAGLDRWWTVAPKRIKVAVVDRNRQTVPNAEVVWWTDSRPEPIARGTTDAGGAWDLSPMFGPYSEPDRLGVRHHYSEQNGGLTDFNAHVFTVRIGDYVDAAVMGSENVNSHGRLTLLHAAMVDPDRYTYIFETNYEPDAPKPDFQIVGAVEGLKLSLQVDGPKGRYRVYRQWEPAYIRKRILELDAGGEAKPIALDMAEADGHSKGRFRAIYEVTRVVDGRESLPRRVSVCGLKNALGISAMKDGRLIVATNAGIANPFAVLFEGTTPAEEFFYHYRFGHTARKIVQSRLDPERFYAILASSDTRPDYRFDIAVPNAERGGYDVRNELGWFACSSFSGSSPQTLQLADASRAALLNPGDCILVGDGYARVTSRDGAKVVTDGPVFTEGATELRFEAHRTAGMPGNRAELRELKDAGGLACLGSEGKEYVAIADTGNRRLVVWDDRTAFVCQHALTEGAPISVAADPVDPAFLWSLVRTPSGVELHRLRFAGGRLEPESRVTLDGIAGGTGGRHPALAVAKSPEGLLIAVADPANRRVCEYAFEPPTLRPIATHRRPVGVFAGPATLTDPVDVAYVESNGALELYVVDGAERVLRLRAAP